VKNYLWALYVTVREEPYRPSRRGRVRETLFGVKKCSTMHNSEDKMDRRIRREETKTCWSHLLSSTSLYSGRAFKGLLKRDLCIRSITECPDCA
jgi:hypothetical protein